MALSYGFVVKEFRYYDSKSTFNTKDDMNTESPPSYPAVLAEKHQQQCATWDKKLNEMYHLTQSLERSVQDTHFMLTLYGSCCQRLESKYQTLLLSLKNHQPSLASDISDTISFDFRLDQYEQAYQDQINDSLNCMNQSLQSLIKEAESSLNSGLPSFDALVDHTSSYSNRSIKNKPCPIQDKQLQQKKRYLYSQWKLAIAMKQLVQTVQTTAKEKKHESEIIEPQNTVIQHHHHHIQHHYHHHYGHPKKTNETTSSQPQMVRSSASSLTSLFKYAINTAVVVGGFIPPKPTVTITTFTTTSKLILHRIMFLSTVLILRKFNYSPLWIRRGKQMMNHWKFRPVYFNPWMHQAQLLSYILHLVSKLTIC